jgi:hypothetical protein
MRYLILLLLCSALNAADRYVSPTGSDTTGTGTISNPWRTITNGVVKMNAGDTLWLRGGTYTDRRIRTAGFPAIKSGPNITTFTSIKGYPGESVLWKPLPQDGLALAVEMGSSSTVQSNFWFEGFTIDFTDCVGGTLTAGIVIRGAANVVMTNLTLLNMPWKAMVSIGQNGCDGLRIEKCRFENWAWSTGGDQPHALYPRYTRNAIIRDNVFIGTGINASYSASAAIHMWGPDTVPPQAGWNAPLIERNVITTSRYAFSIHNPQGAIFRNNIFMRNNAGGAVGQVYREGIASENHLAYFDHNVMYGGTAAVRVGSTYSSRVTTGVHVFRNNILWNHTQAAALYIGGFPNTYWTNNIAQRAPQSGAWGISHGNLVGSQYDPAFINPASPPDGFKWPASSSPWNAGFPLTGIVTTDFYGTTRPADGAWDIGFYEFTSATPPPTPPTSIVANGPFAFEAGLSPAILHHHPLRFHLRQPQHLFRGHTIRR